MNWLLIITSIAWVAGWIISSLLYIRETRREASVRGFSFAWITAIPRVILLAMMWPFYLLGWIYFKRRGEI